MTQLYARIKRTSKYAGQNRIENGKVVPFPVEVIAIYGEYNIVGGIGGYYRMSDVNLYVIDGDVEVRIK